ncbi:MAG: tRNA 2-thiouridine(34) synthase MnmA [Thermomicrobiales bacterium]|nr:tRNA 2-thiouridine(34) synthase MnmA [Thermomicrobiales bacterium]MCO5227078.1 tRNA 2-thiouridine(34) synthase MnmA [Thermomicrobiales bacterium]
MQTLDPITQTVEPRDLASVADLLTEDRIGPRDGTGKTVVVAMSGGVDSAVTALVMRERGYNVVGMNLRLFDPEDEDHRANPCCGIPAMDDARKTCATIGVPFYAINMELEFGANVIRKFVDEYAAGRTPNPCLECNRHVKFRHLVQRARLLGADCLATGHYARIEYGQDGTPHKLYRARDDRKDQSYVLYTLNQDQLGYIQFPLGNLTKPEVRRLAHAFGLPVADKPESQEICFVGNRSYADFVSEHRPDVTIPGDIVTNDGTVVGHHKGLVHHTVGQRRGIGIQAPKPYFVLQLDTTQNQLVVGAREDAEARGLQIDTVSLTSGDWPADPFECEVVVRYRGTPYPGRVQLGSADDHTAMVSITTESGPIASPGQAVVFYRHNQVLGGGTISAVERRVAKV